MTFLDLLLAPLYLLIVILAAYAIRPWLTNNSQRRFFLPALYLKITGAIMVGVVYQFYYSWGDTFSFFRDARIVWETFLDQPISGLRLIFSSPESLKDIYAITNKLWYFGAPSEYNTVRFVAFVSLFTFHTYAATAIVFAFFSFISNWMFFKVLSEKYPESAFRLAIFTLFIPSVIFWGSGIFKDTITYTALMFFFYSCFQIIENRKMSISLLILGVISFISIYSIKKYIVLCFAPVVVLWIVLRNLARIRNIVLRILIYPLVITLAVVGSIYTAYVIGEEDQRYSLDNLAETSMITAMDIRYWTGKDAGSGYTLGELDGTWQTMLKMAPAAVNVSLFRPYLWEISNPLMLMSALESLFMLLISIWVIMNFKNSINFLKDPLVIIMLAFSILFAFAVGVSTFNFGSLVRYKIPFMPFYLAALAILTSKKS